MRIPFLIIFILLLKVASANDSLVSRVFNLTYNMEYEKADSLLKASSNQIDKFYYTVLDIDLSYWRNVTGTNKHNYSGFEETLKSYKNKSSTSTDEKIISLIASSYQLRYELKRFKIFNAISTRKKTMQLYEELSTQNIKLNEEQEELLQLYSALIIYFNNYLKPFFAQSKNVTTKQALLTMETCISSQSKIVHTLSSYFLGKTLLEYEKEPKKAEVLFESLSHNYPNNFKFAELLETCKGKTGN